MALWYYYVGWIIICLIGFFYLASRKKYRDKTAAPNYEEVRNKLTTRKLKVKEKEEVSSGFLGSIQSIFSMIVVVAIVAVIGLIILGSLQSSLTPSSASYNATDSVINAFSGPLSFIFPIMSVAIVLIILGVLVSFIRQMGVV